MSALTSGFALLAILLAMAYKNLPFVWHIRFLRTLITRFFISPVPKDQLSPECLFLPAIHRTKSPLTECDYNIHKSNSTYFTDLDISRGNLSLLLFHRALWLRPSQDTATMILSGVQCVFRREIKPYQPYEVWSRVMTWDEKWLYIVSHFVERNAVRPRGFWLQPGDESKDTKQSGPLRDESAEIQKKVFASSVSRYVFKQEGRKTLRPEAMLVRCGLLPSLDSGRGEGRDDKVRTWRAVEERRRRDLDAAQLKLGWDAVHAAFEGEGSMALGRYTDLLWR